MTVCFDIDGVLCSQTDGDYGAAVPDRDAIALVQRLHASGVRIILHTARYMGRTGGDPAKARALGDAPTRAQLAGWGVPFDELHFGKPRYDLVVDDRGVFFRPDWAGIERLVSAKRG